MGRAGLSNVGDRVGKLEGADSVVFSRFSPCRTGPFLSVSVADPFCSFGLESQVESTKVGLMSGSGIFGLSGLTLCLVDLCGRGKPVV